MATLQPDHFEKFGALVGWTSEDLGDRVMVKLQSKSPTTGQHEVDEVRYFMTKNQAAVLANYLFGISGRLPQPARKRRWFA